MKDLNYFFFKTFEIALQSASLHAILHFHIWQHIVKGLPPFMQYCRIWQHIYDGGWLQIFMVVLCNNAKIMSNG